MATTIEQRVDQCVTDLEQGTLTEESLTRIAETARNGGATQVLLPIPGIRNDVP